MAVASAGPVIRNSSGSDPATIAVFMSAFSRIFRDIFFRSLLEIRIISATPTSSVVFVNANSTRLRFIMHCGAVWMSCWRINLSGMPLPLPHAILTVFRAVFITTCHDALSFFGRQTAR